MKVPLVGSSYAFFCYIKELSIFWNLFSMKMLKYQDQITPPSLLDKLNSTFLVSHFKACFVSLLLL